MNNFTYLVELTPPGRGAVATVLVEGPDALDIVTEHFVAAGGRSIEATPQGAILFGRWQPGGEELIVCRRNEWRVEVHCHGGLAAPAGIVASLVADGCRHLDWRAWVAQEEPDPIVAAARVALAAARTERAARVLLDQFNGALRRAIDELAAFGTADSRAAERRVAELLAASRVGLHLVEPWRVVLAGRPNVGKSSLINALLGYDRAIVFDEPGTTRDVVTAPAAFDGWPVELADTAGLRASAEPLEAAGVRLAEERLANADLVILAFDRPSPWTAGDDALLAAWPQALVVHNKCDLPSGPVDTRPAGLATSALTREGLAELERRIVERLVPKPPVAGDAVPFTEPQLASLTQIAEAIRAGKLEYTLKLLADSAPWRMGGQSLPLASAAN